MFRIITSLSLLTLAACGPTRSQQLPTYGPAPGVQAPVTLSSADAEDDVQEVSSPDRSLASTSPREVSAAATIDANHELDEPSKAYTLRRGETLDHFARWAELPVETIAHASSLPLDAPLPVGTEIVVPASHERRGHIEHARDAHHLRRVEGYLASRGGTVGTEFYVVRTGDSAWTIAKLNGDLPVWLVESFNPSIDVEHLRPGQALMLPLLADTIDTDPAASAEGNELSMHHQ
ncbi:MAG: LysM peptidoglycan-binding domain-containing protein [Myxococcales bacterium]|nr:LysM peptidoglycan-binding domain-containing protein [Myxococcales bacterium]